MADPMQSYLGLDLGTSGLKATQLSEDGRLLAEAEAAYPVDHPEDGWAQTPVDLWQQALTDTLDQLAGSLRAHPPAAIGIDGQMHGLVLADDHGRALAPAMLWSDRRAATVLTRWKALSEDQRARLANPLVPGMTGPLLAWLGENEPDVVDRAAFALLPKDAFRCLLVPSLVTDRSDASASLLWDVPADGWALDVVESVGIPDRLLPPVVGSSEVVGETDVLAGLVQGPVPVVAGAGDTPAARIAIGPAGGLQVNLGSGGQVLATAATPRAQVDPSTHLYADAGDGWYEMAAVQNAGLALDWAARMLGMTWDDLFAAAAAAPTGSGGVRFLPFLQGERGGVAGPGARAAWAGASGGTTREDLARAAVEGMCFTIRRAAELLGPHENGVVTLTGGGGRSPLVRQLLADLMGTTVQRREVRSASATGAAVLAARGVGRVLSPQQPDPVVVEPSGRDDELTDAYGGWLDLLGRLAELEASAGG